MQCPKCNHMQDNDQICENCGLVFAKFDAKQAGIPPHEVTHSSNQTGSDEIADSENIVDEEDLKAEVAYWVDDGINRYAILLCLGFLLPLWKNTLLMGKSQLVWPWQLLMGPSDVSSAAVMATVSQSDRVALWASLPLMVGIALLVIKVKASHSLKVTTTLMISSIVLGWMMIGLFDAAEILGLPLIPPTPAAASIVFLGIVAVALIAASNHARKLVTLSSHWYRLTWISGLYVCLFSVFFGFGSAGVWASWAMMLTYFLLFVLGVSAIRDGWQQSTDYDRLDRMSLIIRATIVCRD